MYMGMGVSGGEEGARNGTLRWNACSAAQPVLSRPACWAAMMLPPLSLQRPSSHPRDK